VPLRGNPPKTFSDLNLFRTLCHGLAAQAGLALMCFVRHAVPLTAENLF